MPRRVAYLLHIFPKLSETFIAGELAELVRRGVEVRVFSLLPPRDELQHAVIAQAGLDRLVCYDVPRFGGELRHFQPEILHAHFATEAAAAARVQAAALGVPFTFTAHGYDIYRKPPADFASRAQAAAAVVTVSRANADYLAATFGVPAGHVYVIPAGVDTERFCPALQSPPDPPLLLCVARLVKVKNLSLLLAACARLRGDRVPFRCVLVGDGPCRAELEHRSRELALLDTVTFAGSAEQDEVRLWWQQARLGTLTSESEGMPVSLMEAAACGVPVVATRVGGIPELVEHEVSGLLVPPMDPVALAAAYQRLLTDADLASQMSRAARARAEEKFSVRNQVASLLQLWDGLLARRKP